MLGEKTGATKNKYVMKVNVKELTTSSVLILLSVRVRVNTYPFDFTLLHILEWNSASGRRGTVDSVEGWEVRRR